MSEYIYAKEIQHGKGVKSDVLALSEAREDWYIIELVLYSDDVVFITHTADRNEAVRTAVNLGEVFQAHAATLQDHTDNIDFLKWICGYREGLMKEAGRRLIDELERERFLAARKA